VTVAGAGARAVVMVVVVVLVFASDRVELLCFGGFSFVPDADDGVDDQCDDDDDAE
jgi:hypothetical protein